jgi:hypothetical protein
LPRPEAGLWHEQSGVLGMLTGGFLVTKAQAFQQGGP